MPSQNVDKVLVTMKQNLDLVTDLNKALTKIFDKAQVHLVVQEKKELMDEFKKLIDSPDNQVHVHWS